MTKEEKIKEAYGRFYKPEKYHFSVNGWVDLNEWPEYEVGKLIDEIDMEFREYSARPKYLQGIENNNGWTRIESEDDLPKDENIVEFWVYDDEEIVSAKFMYESKRWYHDVNLNLRLFPTHYQPIEKPKPPIY